MSKKMLINATHPEENRVAIVNDGLLTELDIEMAGRELTKGNIYKAAVVRVEPGLQAAFVDYGGERLGFLQAGEVHPEFYPKGAEEKKSRPRINEILHRGQELLVQIVKEERGTKGAALTTYLSLAGRYMVLVPGSHLRGISRKIEAAEERRKIKGVMNSLHLPDNVGYIVRTAAIGQSEEELKRDLNYLVRLNDNIVARTKQVQAPALIYKESNLVLRSIRDYFTSDMDEVLIDDEKVHQEARLFFQQVMPEYAHLVKLHQERRPIFARYQIEEQIETITKNKVPLDSGGSIVIDTTEALVAIDVNSGKMSSEQGVESTAFKTNIEAARESARQLRLRDLGGLVVIDFIDMRDRKHIREVEKVLKEAMRNDKARVTVGRISQFGLLEMSRQRIKAALAEGAYNPCPHCNGSGRVKSIEAQAVAFFRRLQAASAKGKVSRVEGEVPVAVADYLLNEKRGELVELEQRQEVTIVVKGRGDFVDGQIELETSTQSKDSPADENALIPLTASPQEITATPDEQKSEPGNSGRRSRRGRRRRKEEPQASGQDTQAAESSPQDKGEAASSQSQESDSAEKPKSQRSRRRGGRRRGGASKEQGEKPESGQENTSQEEPPTEGQGQDSPPTRGNRRTSAEKEQTAAGPATTENQEAQTQDAEVENKQTSRRTSRSGGRKTKAKANEETIATSTTGNQAKEAETQKAPRPSAKKTGTEAAAQSAAEAAGEAQSKEAATKKPAAKKVTRSTAAKSTSKAAAKPATEATGEAPPEEAAARKPAAKKATRSTAAKTTSKAAAKPAAEATGEAPPKEGAKKKPAAKKATRSTAAKTTSKAAAKPSDEAAGETPPKEAAAKKPAAKKATRSTAAKTTSKAAAKPSDEAAGEAPPKEAAKKKPAAKKATRSTTAKTTTKAAAKPAAGATEEAGQKKPATKKAPARTTRKKAVDKTEEPTPPKGATAASKGRKTSNKSADAKKDATSASDATAEKSPADSKGDTTAGKKSAPRKRPARTKAKEEKESTETN